MRLTGWYRLLTVISVVWMLPLAGYVTFSYERGFRSVCMFLGPDTTHCISALWQWVDDGAGRFYMRIDYPLVIALTVVPPLLLWAAFGAVVWIVRGFRKSG
jgi:hypothetical protein